MDGELLQKTIEAMEWMITDLRYRNTGEDGIESPPSPELTEAIETLEELKQEAAKL